MDELRLASSRLEDREQILGDDPHALEGGLGLLRSHRREKRPAVAGPLLVSEGVDAAREIEESSFHPSLMRLLRFRRLLRGAEVETGEGLAKKRGEIVSRRIVAPHLLEDVRRRRLHQVLAGPSDGSLDYMHARYFSAPASPEEQAFADTLTNAIRKSTNIGLTVTSNDSEVIFGQYISATIDIQDIAAVGSGPGVDSAALVAHEVAEQTAAQLQGLPYDASGHAIAHPAGVAAQERVSGYQKVGGSRNFNFQTMTGDLTGVHRRGNSVVTVTFRFVNGNLRQVKRVP